MYSVIGNSLLGVKLTDQILNSTNHKTLTWFKERLPNLNGTWLDMSDACQTKQNKALVP